MKKLTYKSLFVGAVALFALGSGAGLIVNNASGSVGEVTDIEIELDTLTYTAKKLPNGLIGKTYPVFDCKATDNFGNTVQTVEVLVYDPNGELVPVEANRFATAVLGTYTVEYTAWVGSVTERAELKVTVVDESYYTEMSYTINEDIVSEALTGEKIYLYEQKTPKGGFGDIDLQFDIVYNGSYACDEMSVQDYGFGEFFLPEAAGEYKLVYTLTDIVGNVVKKEKSITVNESKTPYLMQPSVSPVFHLGEDMILPETEAKVYVDGKIVYVPVKVSVNGSDVSATMRYTPASAGEYTVLYEADNIFDTGNVAQYECKVSVLDVSEENKPERFVDGYMRLDGFTASYRTRNDAEGTNLQPNVYLLTADGTKTKASMQFKSKIHENYLGMEFASEPTKASFAGIAVTLSDSRNGDEKIELYFAETEYKQVEVTLNGRYLTTLTDKSFTTDTTVYDNLAVNISYDKTSKTIHVGDFSQKLTCYANGDSFKGFTSGYAYVSAVMDGITSESVLKINSIAGDSISGNATDKGKPLIVYSDDYAKNTRCDINTTAVVKHLTAFDLYDSAVSVRVQVISPSKKIIVDEVMTGDCEFKATEYGTYNVLYSFEDDSGNLRQEKSVINCVDRIPPKLEAVEFPSTVKVGDTITLPELVATDNFTQNCTTWIYLEKDNFIKMLAVREYTFISVGEHKFQCYAQDETGNYVYIEYVVMCE